MASLTPKTIDLKGTGISKEGTVATGQTITPGQLLTRASTGIIVHATAAGNAAKLFAKENELLGKTITDTYTAGMNIQMMFFPPGSEVYALLAASGAAVAIGDFVESAGNGNLRKLSASAATSEAQRASVVGIVLEAVTPGGSPTRCRIEIV